MRSAMGVVALALSLLASGAELAAQSIAEALGNQETFAGSGRVVVRTLGVDIVVALDDGADGKVDRLFTVATSGAERLASEVADARVAFWQGRLLVVDPAARKALLFAAPDGDSPRGFGRPGQFLAAAALEESLRGDFDVDRIEDVQWIASRWGRLDGLRLDEVRATGETRLADHLRLVGAALADGPAKLVAQNPTKPGEGSGGCGVSCSQSCSDGSQCAIACNPPRCATCSCDTGASCSCR